MKNKSKYRFLLILVIALFSMSFNQLKSEKNSETQKTEQPNHKGETDPDKNLLIGEWSRTGTPYYIKITGIFDLGTLDVSFYDPTYPYKIEIEMANWTKIGTLLSVYLELKDLEYPGSNFKLNYIPERDVLVGVYYDALRNMSYPMEFTRIQ